MSDKYCLLVWDEDHEGSVVYKEGNPLIAEKSVVKAQKVFMRKLHPESKYRLVQYENLKKFVEFVEAKE